ncbi:uncharacterized protein EAF01_002631 [Botrytis porri]|uniref:uncharacterized protein n=1 Tax=Botrytis porri TaxID=87229 RepID=UPI001900925C|nr:uncharacterized protein EAF01_002631 [Botrytis porri]KAF7911123.1 hypothetical protein EAF01_002631 [Botrytis porri]
MYINLANCQLKDELTRSKFQVPPSTLLRWHKFVLVQLKTTSLCQLDSRKMTTTLYISQASIRNDGNLTMQEEN